MAIYSFVPPLEAKFCGVPSCVFDKLGCAMGEKSLRNTVLDSTRKIGVNGENTEIYSSHYFTLPTNMLIHSEIQIKTEILPRCSAECGIF
jgi:hypothetical protein